MTLRQWAIRTLECMAHVQPPSALSFPPTPLRCLLGTYGSSTPSLYKHGTAIFMLDTTVLANAAPYTRIGEKFLQWTDTSPPLDEILDGATLYWFTDSFPRAIYGYRQFFAPTPQFFHNDPQYYVKKPFGYSWHPEELAPIPVSIVAKVSSPETISGIAVKLLCADVCGLAEWKPGLAPRAHRRRPFCCDGEAQAVCQGHGGFHWTGVA